jgi:hypothetical protein
MWRKNAYSEQLQHGQRLDGYLASCKCVNFSMKIESINFNFHGELLSSNNATPPTS